MNLGGEEVEEERRVISIILADSFDSYPVLSHKLTNEPQPVGGGQDCSEDSPKFLDSRRVPEPDLSEPVADQLGGVELPLGPRGDVPGHVLAHTLPVAERV